MNHVHNACTLIYIYTYISVYIYTHIYTHIHIHTYIYVHIHIYITVFVACAYAYVCACLSVRSLLASVQCAEVLLQVHQWRATPVRKLRKPCKYYSLRVFILTFISLQSGKKAVCNLIIVVQRAFNILSCVW